MSKNDEDAGLLIGLKANDETSQKKLVDKYSRGLLSFALKHELNREDALEVVNDVFYKVILHINDFDPNKGNKFITWLFQIAKNSIIDKHRKKETKQKSFEKNFQPLEEKLLKPNKEIWQESDSLESDKINLSTDLFLETINGLSKTDKILLLERSKGVPFKEIAILIQKTENTAKVAHYRALEKLKKAYIAKIESKDEKEKMALKPI